MKDYEKRVAHCYSEWGNNYFENYYGDNAPYPPVHVHLVADILKNYSVKNILDAGCGPASFLRYLFKDKIKLYGFDLTPEMIAEAKRVFASNDKNPSNVWEGSILELDSFKSPEDKVVTYDSIVCSGVLPHIREEDELTIFSNIKKSLNPGGIALIEARNQFFSLFTMNRYSYDFLKNDLIRADELKDSLTDDEKKGVDTCLQELQKQFRMDLPPIRKGYANEPGYDEVLSRTHNPFVLRDKLQKCGFKELEFKFYHFHPLPPLCQDMLPNFFTKEGVKMENPDDWRGFFMASAFYILGKC